jgi:Trypsin-co-occurring domain 1
MSELIQITTDAGPVLFDAEDLATAGPEQISRGKNTIVQLDERLDDALASVRPAAQAVIRSLRSLTPQELTVEFGIRLDAEAGAVIAKTCLTGHFTVTMKWDSTHVPPASLSSQQASSGSADSPD